jgi:hypothetical protein
MTSLELAGLVHEVYNVVEKPQMSKKDRCLDRGSNTGPLDLQSNALPTELSKPLLNSTVLKYRSQGT